MNDLPQNVQDALNTVNGYISDKRYAVGMLSVWDIDAAKMGAAVLEREWTPARTILVQLFNSFPSIAIDADRLMEMASSRFSIVYNSGSQNELKKALTKLVKEKYLNSRMRQGKRLYELNFAS